MTDAAATPPPSIPERVLELQAVDTEADQLTLQRARHPLRDALAAASGELAAWESRRSALRGRLDELSAAIERAEEQGAELTSHKTRLEAQLKTVIAPREAEALMHEIATIDEQRDALDLQELEALEEQSLRDDELSEHLSGEAAIRDTARRTDEELSAAVAEIDRELVVLDERRDGLRSGLGDVMLATYDRKRAALGVAAATLVGRQCQGCHLDLSAAEVDTVKDEAAATGVTDCPQCGRLLIV
jgi:predicted  nucleic acid-binding Zn-ribbon protein